MYSIRQCSMQDIEAVAGLSALWASEEITHGLGPDAVEDLSQHLGRYFYVSEYEGQIVGFVYGVIRTSEGLAVIPVGERYLDLEELYVHPNHRSNGLGGRLAERLLTDALEEGVTHSLVYSATKDWRRVTDFYQKHGFKMWYVQLYR